MLVHGKSMHTIRLSEEADRVFVIDQRLLPFEFREVELSTAQDAFLAIRDMIVRGAPLIGVTAAFGFWLGVKEKRDQQQDTSWEELASWLKTARPTAVNLAVAVDRMHAAVQHTAPENQAEYAFKEALKIRDEELDRSRQIGLHGVEIIREISRKKQGQPVQILTHCNAGWLACIDYGTALAPIYQAFQEDIPLHVWVDETRPRNQGARLTTWELKQQGVPCTLIVDNAGGLLMQQGKVDVVIVGADRIAINGDVVNKIGTYLKALAAFDNMIPFYVAAPSTTLDWEQNSGITIPIEERDGNEVRFTEGILNGKSGSIRICPVHTAVSNPGFDITPYKLITGLITERGICKADREGIMELFHD